MAAGFEPAATTLLGLGPSVIVIAGSPLPIQARLSPIDMHSTSFLTAEPK